MTDEVHNEGDGLLPSDVLLIDEEINLLPPCPTSLDENAQAGQWKDEDILMHLYKDKWEDNQSTGYPFKTPGRMSRIICQLTNTDMDLSSRTSAFSNLEVQEQATGRVVARTQALPLHQISLTFWSNSSMDYTVHATSQHQAGSFEVWIVCLEGVPEDQQTINMPRPDAQASDVESHAHFLDNFFAPEDMSEEQLLGG